MADQPTIVREHNRAGPCIELGRLVRQTKHFYVFNKWLGGENYEAKETRIAKSTEASYSGAHIEPCSCCRDHPKTQYPNGYMD